VEAAQQQPISQPFIAMRAILDWRSNGGSEAKKCAMAMQQSMLATAIKYGIGTGKNSANAKRMFRRAIGSGNITDYGREEAMYHLAIQFIDEGRLWLAIPLLKRATADDDFPEAASVLNQIKTKSDCIPCRCKRFINKKLRGHTKCLLHTR
jgi:hypothetical protein